VAEFRGIFQLRAIFQDGSTPVWLKTTSQQDEAKIPALIYSRLNSTFRFGTQYSLGEQSAFMIANLPLGHGFEGKDISGNFAYKFQTDKVSNNPTLVVFQDPPNPFKYKSDDPNRMAIFIEDEGEGKIPRYILKVGTSYEAEDLEFASCQYKLCLVTTQWKLDFLRGDLSEYSNSTLADYKLVTLEVVSVV
jgi:hypothetical protein